MDMVAAIQAAKNELEAEKSKRPSKRASITQTAEFNNRPAIANTATATAGLGYPQKSRSFHFGSTEASSSSINPPTNIVSFSPRYERKVSDLGLGNNSTTLSSSSADPYANVKNSSSLQQQDYIHPDYHYDNNNNNDDNDTITSSLSGTLPDVVHDRSLNNLIKKQSSPALTKEHLLASLASSGGCVK